MFGNEGDRPYVLQASPESLAAMASAIGQLKRLLKVPFGVNYLWDPVATVALGAATGASFGREIFTGVYALGHGRLGAEMRRGAAAAAQSGPRRHEAAVQHQRRVRRAAGHPPDRQARHQCGVLVPGRYHLRLRPDDRRGGRQRRSAPGEGCREGCAGLRQHRRQYRQRAGHPAASPTAASSAPISRRPATPGTPSTATG